MRDVRERKPEVVEGTTEPQGTAAARALGALSRANAFNEKARKLAEVAPPRRRLAFAQGFCRRLVARYWEAKSPRSRRSLRACPVALEDPKNEALELAEAFGVGVAQLDVDQAAYVIGRTYAAMLPQDFRSENGVFYTPPPVVQRLLDSAEAAGVDWKTCRILEPACGGGAFLGPLARRMVRAMAGADRRVVGRNLRTRLTGYEIDPFAAWLSTVLLDATIEQELGFSFDDELATIEVRDSLAHPEVDSFDLVIANPPYGRLALDPGRRAEFKRSLFGHANLYGLFLDLAVRKCALGGLIAYVTPTGFLCGEYFKRLRALLADEAPPIGVDFISQREGVFDDVLQETVLALFKRGGKPQKFDVHFVDVGSDAVSAAAADSAPLPMPAENPWIVARSKGSTTLAGRLRSMPTRLADWGYRVSTGPLVWNRHKDQLRHAPERGAVPVLWAEAVSADGKFEFRAARRNRAPYFVPRTGDDDWLLVRRPCVLLQRTTAKEQPRRLIAAELPASFLAQHGAITVENHLNMVVPTSEQPAVSTPLVAAFLNTSAADRAFRCISGTVAVSAYELESMPLPPVWALEDAERAIATGDHATVERAFTRLYGGK